MIPIRQAEIFEKEGLITIEWENKQRTVQVAAENEGHLLDSFDQPNCQQSIITTLEVQHQHSADRGAP